MPRVSYREILLLVLLATTPGCGDDETEPITPIDPTPPAVTETFSGAINPNGAATHPFPSQFSGTLAATLTSVGPDSSVVVGLSLGTWNGAICQIVLANDQATQGAIIVGRASSAGSYCVRVYDVGKLTQSTSYEIQVTHP